MIKALIEMTKWKNNLRSYLSHTNGMNGWTRGYIKDGDVSMMIIIERWRGEEVWQWNEFEVRERDDDKTQKGKLINIYS